MRTINHHHHHHHHHNNKHQSTNNTTTTQSELSDSTSTELLVVESVQGYVLFINNIDRNIDAETLTDTLSDYGHVITVHYELSRRTGIPLGFALVKYENLDQARDALEGLRGKRLGSQVLNCDWCFRHKVEQHNHDEQIQEEVGIKTEVTISHHDDHHHHTEEKAKSIIEEDHSEDKRKRDDHHHSHSEDSSIEPPLKKVK